MEQRKKSWPEMSAFLVQKERYQLNTVEGRGRGAWKLEEVKRPRLAKYRCVSGKMHMAAASESVGKVMPLNLSAQDMYSSNKVQDLKDRGEKETDKQTLGREPTSVAQQCY